MLDETIAVSLPPQSDVDLFSRLGTDRKNVDVCFGLQENVNRRVKRVLCPPGFAAERAAAFVQKVERGPGVHAVGKAGNRCPGRGAKAKVC